MSSALDVLECRIAERDAGRAANEGDRDAPGGQVTRWAADFVGIDALLDQVEAPAGHQEVGENVHGAGRLRRQSDQPAGRL